MATTHKLKCWPDFYDAILSRDKNFDVRKNDRNFQVGDYVQLQRFDPKKNKYDCPRGGKHPYAFERQIKYILHGGQFGIDAGYAVLGF